MSKYILHSILLIFTAIAFTSCGDDKDEPQQLSPANAKGIFIWDYDANGIEKDDITLWINDYSIFTINRNGEAETDLSTETNQSIAYYTLSMDILYEMLSEDYSTEINASTDLSNFIPDPKGLINYVKSNKSKYRYIAKRGGDIILFNRISNTNYQ